VFIIFFFLFEGLEGPHIKHAASKETFYLKHDVPKKYKSFKCSLKICFSVSENINNNSSNNNNTNTNNNNKEQKC
jgi:DNA gyrase inhibitor GyrI